MMSDIFGHVAIDTPATTDVVEVQRITGNRVQKFQMPLSSVALTGVASTTSASQTFTGSVIRASQKRIYSGYSKVGGTAGWTVGGGAVNTGLTATMAAGQTAGTLVVPISGLKVGDTITSFHLIGQVESAGNNVTIDADLRKHTAAAADVADASVGAITQLVVAVDTILSSANTNKGSLAEVVAADETFYVLLTATTTASTDIALQGIAVTVTEA
jgi:hypothetical protein